MGRSHRFSLEQTLELSRYQFSKCSEWPTPVSPIRRAEVEWGDREAGAPDFSCL